jgi:hypothetical protein
MQIKLNYVRTAISGFIILISFQGISQVKPHVAETIIRFVTIYSSGARIERTGSVYLQAGRSEISFSGLSNQLEQQTVQLKADADITLLSVQTTRDFVTARTIDQQEKDLIEHAGIRKDRLDMDTKQLEVYKNEESMLIKNQSIGGQSGVKAADLKESLDLQRVRLTEVYGKQLEIQKRILLDQQDVETTNRQLVEISKKKDSVSFIVTASVENKEPRTVNFELFYNIKDAGWFPTYDVRVNEVSEPLSLLMNANIYQRSGETWKNVSLLLSTGNPNDNATPSTLQPWMLGFYDPSASWSAPGPRGNVSGRVTDPTGQPVSTALISIRNGGYNTVTDVNGFFKMTNISSGAYASISAIGFQSREIRVQPGYMDIKLDQAATALNEEVVVGYGTQYRSDLQGIAAGIVVSNKDFRRQDIKMVTVVTQTQPTTTVFKIDDRYTLETDGKTTTVGIKSLQIPAKYDYYTAPKVDPSVFLTAKVPGWQDYNLQSGEVSLYYEGTYLGKTYLDIGNITDTLSLSLGKDNSVKVSRKLLKKYSSKKFLGSNLTENKDYEISVENSKSVPVDLMIVDQIPVSTTKEISVEDVQAPEGQINKESGIVSWTIMMQPQQAKKLTIGYSVKYPKDKKVILE